MDKLLSSFGFNFNLRPFSLDGPPTHHGVRCLKLRGDLKTLLSVGSATYHPPVGDRHVSTRFTSKTASYCLVPGP